MNRTIKLSLIAFILVGGGNLALADTIPSTAINSLAYHKITLNSKQSIVSNTYNKATDITFTSNNTGTYITLGEKSKEHTIKDVNINLTQDNGRIWTQGNLTLNNMNISKVSNSNHGFIVDNNANVKMVGGSLKNIAINLGSSTTARNGNVILDGVIIDNIKYGYNTQKDANFSILNSTINNGDFNYKTTFDNSQVNGNISGELNFTNKSKINATISSGNITLDNSEISGSINAGNLTANNNSKINATITLNNGNLTLDNSEISGSITASNLTATNGSIINSNSTISGTTDIKNSTIKADITSSTLKIVNSTASGTTDSKINLNTSGLITTSGNVTLNNIAVSRTNPVIGNTAHHITLGNNSNDHNVNLTINNSNFTNTAINRYSKDINNSILTINKSTLTDVNFGNTDAGLDIVNITDSTINNTTSGVGIDKGNFNITNSNITSTITGGTLDFEKSDFSGVVKGGTLNFKNSTITNSEFIGGTLNFKNSTITNSEFIGGKIYFDGLSSVSGTLKGANIYLNDENKKVLSDIIYEKGLVIAEQSLKFDGKEDFKDKEYNFGFFVENDVTLDINNLKMSNNSINAWRKNSADSLVNNKVNISNSSLKEVGIGIHNNSSLIKYMTDYLSFTKTTITNNNANNMIYAKVIDIKDSNITAPMITTLNQEYLNSTSNAIYYKINKIGTFLNIDNSIINSSVETGELHLKNNSVLNGNIQGTQKVYIDNSTLNGNITKDNRNTCFEHEGCSKEVEDVIITNSTIKGDINEVGNVSLTNTNLEASNVIVKNDIIIDNSTSTEAKTITGNFKVGN
ncbi:beta strand repeat-containing protein, partial [Campylobacter sp. RM12647]|uniref:beta strand repeat-containing protein n=1 Tax=Campylobacter sp. RM12647 TaxID=2735737 RepID=UPI001D566981|nr:hypothetical protein [Campylobacter sp. RM12647]